MAKKSEIYAENQDFFSELHKFLNSKIEEENDLNIKMKLTLIDDKYDKLYMHIQKKLGKITEIRKLRLNSFIKNKNMNEKWEVILLVYNIIAVILVIFSLSNMFSNIAIKNLGIISSIFSIYVILIQNYVSKKDFNGRKDKFYSNQLSIKTCIEDLRSLFLDGAYLNNIMSLNNNMDIIYKLSEDYEKKLIKYELIIQKYQEIIAFTENYDGENNAVFWKEREIKEIQKNLEYIRLQLLECNDNLKEDTKISKLVKKRQSRLKIQEQKLTDKKDKLEQSLFMYKNNLKFNITVDDLLLIFQYIIIFFSITGILVGIVIGLL